MTERALYYPYIHIQNVEWLKATLLLFSQVRRMTPTPGVQPWDGAIAAFTQWNGDREPLLASANLWSERAQVAQADLANRLLRDAQDPNFVNRFGCAATVAERPPGKLGFQIHQAKLHDSLKEALSATKLAWDPQTPEPYDYWREYVELNPRLGQAVMSTLAIACAMAEGLAIVGDERSGQLHECLTRRRPKDVYDVWLKGETNLPDPLRPTGNQLFDFVVAIACDTSKLDAKTLAEMTKNREPIQRLMTALGKRAKRMAAMDPGRDRHMQFKDETLDVLKAWQQDRANMDNFWSRLFGRGLLEPGAKLLEKVIEGAAKAAPAAGTAAAGTLAGLALGGPLLASGAGVAIGLFTHAAKTYLDMVEKDRESPYRYLTVMEKAGVVIRTNLREIPEEMAAPSVLGMQPF